MGINDLGANRRGQRHLRPDEIDLWLQVVAKVKRRAGAKIPLLSSPLMATRPSPANPASQPNPASQAKPASMHPTPPRIRVESYQAVPPTHPTLRENSLPNLDPPLRKRLRRGHAEIEGRLDLHGMRQEQAHQTLRHFIVGAQARGARVVMVVTGKGSGMATHDDHERGVLRRMTPFWLQAPDLRPLIIGIESAARHHGGEGAIYIHLRRRA